MSAPSGEVRALHLLCKHSESRNPISRRTNAPTTGVAKESAIEELTTIRAAIMAEAEGKTTQELVRRFCPPPREREREREERECSARDALRRTIALSLTAPTLRRPRAPCSLLRYVRTYVQVDIFAKEAQKRSDCGSYRSGGDLGFFGRGAMQKPFEEATYALSVGEVSGVVNTDSGSHIIMRIA